MATKTISITEEAYERLKDRKKEHESVSDVVYKITRKKSLLELAGTLSEKDAVKMEEGIKKIRTLSDNKVSDSAKMFKK